MLVVDDANLPSSKRKKVDIKAAEIEEILNETLKEFRAPPNPTRYVWCGV